MSKMEEKDCPVTLIFHFVKAIKNLHQFFHRDFAIPYVKRLQKAIWSNVLNCSVENLRNFSKETIDSIA